MNTYEIILSILIPIFNCDVTPLTQKLVDQILENNFNKNIELILIDDASTNIQFTIQNENYFSFIQNKVNLFYKKLEYNLGRSKVRNILINESKGNYLLFLDSDALPDNQDFISKYFNYALTGTYDVICGGRSYLNVSTQNKDYLFYIFLSKKTEAKSALIRNQKAWAYIFTFNLLVRKSLMKTFPFCEEYFGYGYEDTDWAARACPRAKVIHIENTATHLGLITKETVFKKLKEASYNHYLFYLKHAIHFKQARAYKYLRCALLLKKEALISITQFLESLSKMDLPVLVEYFLYQMLKVVYLSINIKTNDSQ